MKFALQKGNKVTRATIRQWHSYIGLFIAPSVLFFALTGAVQLYSLHEAHGDYIPPAIVEKLSSVHKDQVFAPGDHHPDAGADDHTINKAPEDEAEGTKLSSILLKGFFLFVSVCLLISTAFGVWMGLTQTRHKRTALLMIILGTIIPLGMLFA